MKDFEEVTATNKIPKITVKKIYSILIGLAVIGFILQDYIR